MRVIPHGWVCCHFSSCWAWCPRPRWQFQVRLLVLFIYKDIIDGIYKTRAATYSVPLRTKPHLILGRWTYAVTIFPDECKQDSYLLDWDVKRYGPYTVCTGGRVTFRWRGMHGVFQIPSIACPSNFTAQQSDSYKYLTSVSNGGGYEWKVPDEPGHYWVTSQHTQDCQHGMSFFLLRILLHRFDFGFFCAQ